MADSSARPNGMGAWIAAHHHPLARRLVYLRDLVVEMVVREVRIRYKRSALGVAWSMLNPLLHLLVFYFVFQVVIALDTPRFTSFALVGLLAWMWSSSALSQAAGGITQNASLLRQPGFPSAAIVPITVTTHLVYYLLALPVLLAFLIVGGSRPGWSLLALPLVLVVQFLVTITLAYTVAAVNAHFRDTQHFLDVVLRLSMFISPIFYEASRVPEDYQWLYQINPMVPLLDAYRALLLFGTTPDWERLVVVALVFGGTLYPSLRLYRRAARRTVDEL